MKPAAHPTKEQVRLWQQHRLVEHKPPPTPEQIRIELGWNLIKGAKCAR